MQVQKQELIISLCLILMVVIGATVYYWPTRQTAQPVNTNQPLVIGDLAVNYDQPINIDVKKVNWVKAQFPANDYHHDLDVWYPDGWSFDCCGDTDSFSAHTVWPVAQADWEKNAQTPHITYFDQSLSACPDTNPECSIDQAVLQTADQIFAAQKRKLTNFAELKLSNFANPVLVYDSTEDDQAESKNYLINTGTGVSLIKFYRFAAFPADLINEFLQHLQNVK